MSTDRIPGTDPAPTPVERTAGGLLGVAVGDALGATLEFMTPEAIAERHGVHREITGGGSFRWRPGQGTDDTDLTWAVARSYLDGPWSLDRVAGAFLEWYHGSPRDIGGTTARALARLDRTGDPITSGETGDRSCGNGSLMRCIPTALVRADPEVRRRELREISAVTHAHPLCLDSCVAYGEIVAALLEGAEPDQAIEAAASLPLRARVLEALAVDPDTPPERLSTSGFVIDSLRCAVWALGQDAELEEILVTLVNRGDDTDTTGAIAGGLLGVARGVDAIPSRWLERLEYLGPLTGAAVKLTRPDL